MVIQRRIIDIIVDKYAAMTNQQRLSVLEEKYLLSEIEDMYESEALFIEDDIVRVFINKKGELIYAEYVSSPLKGELISAEYVSSPLL